MTAMTSCDSKKNRGVSVLLSTHLFLNRGSVSDESCARSGKGTPKQDHTFTAGIPRP